MKIIKLFAIIITIGLCMISCGNDEPDSSNNADSMTVEQELTKYAWYGKTEDISEKFHDTRHETYYFLGNGKGVIDIYVISKSIYGDTERSRYSDYFTYKVTDNLVKIKYLIGEGSIESTFTYNISSLTGVFVIDDIVLTPRELTSEDKDRIIAAKYESMEDEERFKFTIGFINEERKIERCTDAGYRYHSYLYFGIATLGSEHLSSRKIDEVKCTVHIDGGKFLYPQKTSHELTLLTSDNDQSKIDGPLEIYRNDNAKLQVSIDIYDRKTNKYIYLDTTELTFDKNPLFEDDNSGGENGDNNNNNNNDNVNPPPNDDEKYQGSANGHKWIDLGLPSGTKWASMNVGAASEYEVGKYYMWGSTSDDYSWSSHPLLSSPDLNWSKYNSKDSRKQLEPEDDAATVIWGNSWKIPSPEQFMELYKFCKIEIVNNGSQKYHKYIGPNSQSIIIPLGGIRDCFNQYESANEGFALWTNEAINNDEGGAKACQSGILYYLSVIEVLPRLYSCNLRAVLK